MNPEPGQTTTSLPRAMTVRDLLQGMLGRDVDVATGASMVNPSLRGSALVGIFVNRFLKLSALMLLDIQLAARAGAAIALVPSRAAEEAIEDRDLPESLLDNASEILNVATSLFNVGSAPGDPLPNDVARWGWRTCRDSISRWTSRGTATVCFR
jgi:hypothetical protein